MLNDNFLEIRILILFSYSEDHHLFQTVRQCAAMAGSDLRGVGKSSPIPVVSLLISSSENKENTMDSGNKETSKSESEVCLSLGRGIDQKFTSFSGCRGLAAIETGRHHGSLIFLGAGRSKHKKRLDGDQVR